MEHIILQNILNKIVSYVRKDIGSLNYKYKNDEDLKYCFLKLF